MHKRYAEIMPGDVVVLQNALFKGTRGQMKKGYKEELGTNGEPVVGVVGEFDSKKTKARVYQANQHVGLQVRFFFLVTTFFLSLSRGIWLLI